MMLPLLLTLSLGQYTPQEAQALFVEANDAYYKGDYDAAATRYQKLLDAQLSGPDVLFNLGTTQLAAGKLGPAVLFLERAAQLSDDDDIQANLGVARARQGDKVVGEETATPFTQRLAASMNERWVAIGFLATWWLGFALLWLARRSNARLVLGLTAAVLLLGGALLGGALGIAAHVRATVQEAVVMPEVVQVREFPGEAAKVAFEVHAGLKVRVMETSGKFARVRLPNSLEGWADKESLVEL